MAADGAATEATQIDLIRHGEHQLGEVVCGATDPELTARGWSQLRQRIAALEAHGGWHVCVTSPRRRCAEFARKMAAARGLPCAEEPGFAEVDFGAWEALSFNEIQRRHPGQWQRWINFPDEPAPHGGERHGAFVARVAAAWDGLVARHRGRSIVVFAHGGVIRAVFRTALGLDSGAMNRFSIPHACHTRIKVWHHPGKPDLAQLEQHGGF